MIIKIGDRVSWSTLRTTYTGIVRKVFDENWYMSGCPDVPFCEKGDLVVEIDQPQYYGQKVVVVRTRELPSPFTSLCSKDCRLRETDCRFRNEQNGTLSCTSPAGPEFPNTAI